MWKRIALFLLAAMCLVIFAPAGSKVIIQYHGQSCFSVKFPNEPVVIFDPYGTTVKYTLPAFRGGVILISHEHRDHNNFEDIQGFPVILHGLGKDGGNFEKIDFTLRGLHITSLPSYHDAEKGATRGLNTIFIIDVGSFRLAHLGDLGHDLTPEQASALRGVNVLLIPVGGFFTIDADVAAKIVNTLKPPITIPMHYKTEVTSTLPIDGVDRFLKHFTDVFKPGKNTLEVDLIKPPAKPGIYVLEYK